MMERLNKVLARAGITSRRGADALIEQGRVTVNGSVIRELGVRVDPGRDAIKVDGRIVAHTAPRLVYFMMNKPRGCVTTLDDPEGRPTVRDLLRGIRERVYPVGRLDFNSEGLLLFTNDGDLARDLMHPRSGVVKTYALKVRGTPDAAALDRLRRGVVVDDRRVRAIGVTLRSRGPSSHLEVRVGEGRKHMVRRMLEAVGHPVVRLRRVRYAGLGLGDLATGAVRELTAEEIAGLRAAASGTGPRPARRRGPAGGKPAPGRRSR